MDYDSARKILGIDEYATEQDIRTRYKRLAIVFHPDKNNGNDEEFKKINEAYRLLTDPQADSFEQFFSLDLNVTVNVSLFDIINKTPKQLQLQSFEVSLMFDSLDCVHEITDGLFTYNIMPALTTKRERGFKFVKPNHISTNISLDLISVLYGTTVNITDPYGKKQKIVIKPIKKLSQRMKILIPGRGLRSSNSQGDLIVNVTLHQPNINTDLLLRHENIIRQLFS